MFTINKLNIAAVVALTMTSLPAFAKSEPGAVGIGGETLFVLKSSMDLGKSMDSRVGDVYDRIRYILNNPHLKGKDIKVKPMGDYGYKITANNELIVPIGPNEASAHGMTMEALAKDWAIHLRKVLPKLTARPDLLAMRYTSTKRSIVRRR